jgi:hypothetical protein
MLRSRPLAASETLRTLPDIAKSGVGPFVNVPLTQFCVPDGDVDMTTLWRHHKDVRPV